MIIRRIRGVSLFFLGCFLNAFLKLSSAHLFVCIPLQFLSLESLEFLSEVSFFARVYLTNQIHPAFLSTNP